MYFKYLGCAVVKTHISYDVQLWVNWSCIATDVYTFKLYFVIL